MRPDLVSDGALRLVVLYVGLMGLVAVASAVSLRGYHRKPLGGLTWGLIGVSLGVPVVLALFPGLWTTGAVLTSPPARACFAFGAVSGTLAAGAVSVFQRADQPSLWRIGAAAAAGGLTAFAALQLHCPSQDVGHILIGHAAIGFVLTAVALVYAATRRARSQRATHSE